MPLLFCLTLLIFSGCATVAEHSNIYVDSYYGNDGNDGSTPSTAFKSLSKLNDYSFSPGDTVFLKAGSIWFEELIFTSSGSPDKPIVITCYGNGEKPKIDGQSIKRNNILIEDIQNSEIHNLFLTGSNGSGGIRIKNSDNIKIINCEFIVTGHGGVFIEKSRNCTISGNMITSPKGILMAQTDGIYSQRNDNILIENNKIILQNEEPGCHCDGIQSYLDKDMLIRGNYIFQNNLKTNAQGIYATNAQGRHVYANNIIYCPNTLAAAIGFRNLDKGYGSLELYNNTIKSRGSNNLSVTEVSSLTVKNNIFVTTSEAYIINIGSRIDKQVSSFSSNIYFRAGEGYVVNYQPAGGVQTFLEWQMEGFDINSLITDPLLDSNLSISASSPAVDAGEIITDIELDFITHNGPKGERLNIGAYEFRQKD